MKLINQVYDSRKTRHLNVLRTQILDKERITQNAIIYRRDSPTFHDARYIPTEFENEKRPILNASGKVCFK